MKKLSVVHVFSGDLWAGAEVMIFNLLSELNRDSNIQLTAISLNSGKLTKMLAQEGVDTIIISERTYSFLALCKKISAQVKKLNADIIHSHRYKEDLLAFLASKATGGTRLVTTMHGMPESYAAGSIRFFKHKAHFTFLKWCFDTVVIVSGDMKERLVKNDGFGTGKLKVIHNGIKCLENQSRVHEPNSTFHIGSVGRLVPVKDYDFFLLVVANIATQMENVHFSILGNGPLRQSLKLKIKALNIEDKVELLAARPDPWGYYKSLDLYLCTSIHEGLPLSILEAMATGTTVVAPRVGGIPEIIEDGVSGILTNTRNVAVISSLCIKLLKDEDKRYSIEANAFNRIKKAFTAHKMTEHYKDVYLQNG